MFIEMKANPAYALQNLSSYLIQDPTDPFPQNLPFHTEPFIISTMNNAQRTPFSLYEPVPASELRKMSQDLQENVEFSGDSTNRKRKQPEEEPNGSQAIFEPVPMPLRYRRPTRTLSPIGPGMPLLDRRMYSFFMTFFIWSF